jgi:hypothetical protein
MRFDHPKPLTPAQQFVNLRHNPVCAGRGTLRNGRLDWRFKSQPTPLSRAYDLSLRYRPLSSPDVLVVEPDLTVLAKGRKLPHVYQQRPTMLCLYLPGTAEWTSAMRIDATIIPWSALWLFYFEEWLTSNEWKGGGKHPDDTQ